MLVLTRLQAVLCELGLFDGVHFLNCFTSGCKAKIDYPLNAYETTVLQGHTKPMVGQYKVMLTETFISSFFSIWLQPCPLYHIPQIAKITWPRRIVSSEPDPLSGLGPRSFGTTGQYRHRSVFAHLDQMRIPLR